MTPYGPSPPSPTSLPSAATASASRHSPRLGGASPEEGGCVVCLEEKSEIPGLTTTALEGPFSLTRHSEDGSVAVGCEGEGRTRGRQGRHTGHSLKAKGAKGVPCPSIVPAHLLEGSCKKCRVKGCTTCLEGAHAKAMVAGQLVDRLLVVGRRSRRRSFDDVINTNETDFATASLSKAGKEKEEKARQKSKKQPPR